QLAVFSLLGSAICFLMFPVHKRWKDVRWLRVFDMGLVVLFALCCGYLISEGQALTNDRVGRFTTMDHWVAILATLLVLEATRRSIGLALPILAGVFLLYAYYGRAMPDWFFPHRGYDIDRIASQAFLGSKGVFGVAMGVMFRYVFLFVVFGAFLEMSGATQFIIDFAQRMFGSFSGGPAMVSVAGAGLMGSLSGSAVANAVTTGTFTIPMMRSAGFKPTIAGGITAAAASGGALMPPVMGAGAYMMLEIIDNSVAGLPPITFLQIAKAALVPALLYYLSLLLIVYFYSRRIGRAPESTTAERPSLLNYEGLVFSSALGSLVAFLLVGFTPFRAVTYSLEVILLLSIFSPRLKVSRASRYLAITLFLVVMAAVAITRAGGNPDSLIFVTIGGFETVILADWKAWADAGIPAMLTVMLAGFLSRDWRPLIHGAFMQTARSGVALVSAGGCVGVIIGVVLLTGVGTEFPNAIVPLAEQSLMLALMAIMFCSIILGMGLPSAVCYLLMATLIGPVLGKLALNPADGTLLFTPLAAHLFIFYFGMMSMVTPPVALAAYASASIAKAKIMPTAMASFRFALVGFTLPYMFIYRPALLLLKQDGHSVTFRDLPTVALAIVAAVVGIVALAAGIAGHMRRPLKWPLRIAFLVSAAMLLITIDWLNLAGALLFAGAAVMDWLSPAGDVGSVEGEEERPPDELDDPGEGAFEYVEPKEELEQPEEE
ncbi:MAG: TRAP transporter fused permease subunit, partial [Pirellulaceae bacterium]